MRAIVPTQRARVRPYTWGEVLVNPDPPRAGEETRISFPLTNPGPGEVVVERIDVRIAEFGMGLRGEQLPPAGPVILPPDPERIETVVFTWTPERAGHRCVRAELRVRNAPSLYVGRNLDVIQANATDELWRVPFRLGNPSRKAAPIVVRVGGEGAMHDLEAAVWARGQLAHRPIWLGPREEVDATLELRAAAGPEVEAVRTVEAYHGDRLIDGIQVTLWRPALVAVGHGRMGWGESEVAASAGFLASAR